MGALSMVSGLHLLCAAVAEDENDGVQRTGSFKLSNDIPDAIEPLRVHSSAGGAESGVSGTDNCQAASWSALSCAAASCSTASAIKLKEITVHSNLQQDSCVGSRIKGPWRSDEDEVLKSLVEKMGPRRWSLIALHIPGRTGKQARERWLNQLSPALNKIPWTAAEDLIIVEGHARLGNKWSEIAKLLKGRSDNAVKNRFNSTIRKQLSGEEDNEEAGVDEEDSIEKNGVHVEENER
uniref:Uncharacterized protein n=1 Tax=Timspurckia oligopyrenoides TaxID=708627 RepID=A0A7S0ZEJ7_9RHOD|mmetsp:Transcript_2269/g.3986  ORF Transcript_2269/g.3986 Transcript_2269/m.3986 type:complete len:237 (+) Transcript_2269:90-800(+)